MDPYLELHWRDVHHSLIQYTRDSLQPRLPQDLRARVEERVFLETDAEPLRQPRHFYPDVEVATTYPKPIYEPMVMREGGTTVAEPIVFENEELEITEGYIEIREVRGGKVVTVIEFLSPTNKRPGPGRDEYLRKQGEVLRSDASLVEVDLVRAGQRAFALAEDRIPTKYRREYLTCISPGWFRGRRELYILSLRQRLPIVPIPLRKGDQRITLDLQALVDQAYVTGRYDTLDYASELEPPLAPEEQTWLADLLKNGHHAPPQ